MPLAFHEQTKGPRKLRGETWQRMEKYLDLINLAI